MKCREIQVRLADYSVQRSDPRESREIQEHLSGCPECRRLLAEEALVTQRLGSVPRMEPRRDLWADVRNRLPERAPAPVRSLRQRLGLGVAAATALAAAATFALLPHPTQTPRATAVRPPAATSTELLRPEQHWAEDDPLEESMAPLEALVSQVSEVSNL